MPAATITQKLPPIVDPQRRYTVEEWLAIEEATGERYEFHEGKLISVRAMSGGTGYHALLGANVIGSVYKVFSSREQFESCHVYSSDLRLMITTEERYVYPDAAVICGKPEYDELVPTAARNPIAVMEVLSPSSAGYDLGQKFDYYATLPTLRDYVIVHQDGYRVEVRHREGYGQPWQVNSYTDKRKEASLPGLGVTLPLHDLYRGFTPEP